MEFDELFALEDTIRLDPSVLIGSISVLKVSSRGELLVQDDQSNALHLFSPDGTHLRALSITDCNPEAELEGFGSHSTFLDDSRILAITSKGAMIFDHSGQCVESSTDDSFVTNTWAACSFRDTIFAMPRTIRDSTHISAYSSDLTLIKRFPLPAARFPRRSSIYLPYSGLTIGCFGDDVWWVYGEDFDATPRLRRSGYARYEPAFYRPRKNDYPELPLVDQSNWNEVNRILIQAESEASSVQGMFALDKAVRLVLYLGIDADDEAATDASATGHSVMGALVASHDGAFDGVTTLVPDMPDAAGHGKLYYTGAPEASGNDELANPFVVMYRFLQPGDRDN